MTDFSDENYTSWCDNNRIITSDIVQMTVKHNEKKGKRKGKVFL